MYDVLRILFKKSISILLIVLTVCSLYNTGFNGHYHKQADGTMIYHYHPYSSDSSSPIQKHSHTQYELFIIALANSSIFVFIAIFSGLYLISKKKIVYYYRKIDKLTSLKYLNIKQFRAPPVY